MEFESCVFELVKAVGKKAPFATKNPQMLEASCHRTDTLK